MRFYCLVLLACAAMVRSAAGQTGPVSIDLQLDENNFLPGEEIYVGVRISNLSGGPLTFGTTTNWLTFFVETRQGEALTRLGDVPVRGEFTLASAKAGTKWWNIQPYFDFAQPGPHSVYAELRVPGQEARLLSDPVSFTLQTARKLWEISFGVPSSANSPGKPPEIRRYSLQAATRSSDRNLYVRVSDETDTVIYKVILLDRLLSFANPRQQLDGQNRLHVLFQTGGSVYTYCVVTPTGELAIRQKHEIVQGVRPSLAKLDDGNIVVMGGARRPSMMDIPPYVPPPPETVAATNAPTATNAPAQDKSTKKTGRRSKQEAAPAP